MIGYKNGILEVSDFSNFKLLNSRQAHFNQIKSLDYIQNKYIIVTSSSDGLIKLWDVFILKLFKQVNFHQSPVSFVKYELNRLYSCGGDGKVYYCDSNFTFAQNAIKAKSYKLHTLALSVELQLIAFGNKTLSLYCLKNDIEIGSVYLNGFINCLCFIKLIIGCAND